MSSKNSRSISSNWLTRVSDEIEALNEIYLDTVKLITPNQTIQIKTVVQTAIQKVVIQDLTGLIVQTYQEAKAIVG